MAETGNDEIAQATLPQVIVFQCLWYYFDFITEGISVLQ